MHPLGHVTQQLNPMCKKNPKRIDVKYGSNIITGYHCVQIDVGPTFNIEFALDYN